MTLLLQDYLDTKIAIGYLGMALSKALPQSSCTSTKSYVELFIYDHEGII